MVKFFQFKERQNGSELFYEFVPDLQESFLEQRVWLSITILRATLPVMRFLICSLKRFSTALFLRWFILKMSR